MTIEKLAHQENREGDRRLPLAPREAMQVPSELAALDDTNRLGRGNVAKIGHARTASHWMG